MATVLLNDQYLSDTADAIREKAGTTQTYTPAQFADAISGISGGGISGWEDVSNLVTITSLWNDTSTLEINLLLAIRHDYGNGSGALVLSLDAADSQGMNFRISLDESIWPQAENPDIAIFNTTDGMITSAAPWGGGEEPDCFEAHDDTFNHLLYSTQFTVYT